jgi:hypothetical protein
MRLMGHEVGLKITNKWKTFSKNPRKRNLFGDGGLDK